MNYIIDYLIIINLSSVSDRESKSVIS